MKKLLLAFGASILLMFLGMVAVYCIPNSAVERWYRKSLNQLAAEEEYPAYFFNTDGAIMDNFMDGLLIRSCHVSEVYDSVPEAAMDNNGYPRYWNGYLLTLRPLLTLFSYQQIRYLNMFLFMLLLCFCFNGTCARCSKGIGTALLIALCMVFPVLIPESLQYLSVFLVMFALVLLLLSTELSADLSTAAALFLLSGAWTNFFDMLTAPLLSLGIPLVIELLLSFRRSAEWTFRAGVWRMFLLSAAWGAGYALTWVMKWLLGTLILGKNVFADALTTAQFRAAGSEAYPLDRRAMLLSNINAFYFAKGRRPALLLALLVLLLLARALRHPAGKTRRLQSALLGIVALFPYGWFLVLANHSQLHYFYTYRIQAVTVFAVLAALVHAGEGKHIL